MIMVIEFGFQAIGRRGGLFMAGKGSGFQAPGNTNINSGFEIQ